MGMGLALLYSMRFRAVVLCSIAVLGMFRAFAGVETLDTPMSSESDPWFKNTKEYQSLYVHLLPELYPEEVSKLGSPIREFFSFPSARGLKCESEILSALSHTLEQSGVRANRRTIRGALKYARSENLIDDVALTPLLWILDAVDPIGSRLDSDEDQGLLDLALFRYSALAPIPKTEAERSADRQFEQKCQQEESKKLEEQNSALLSQCYSFYYLRLSSQCSVVAFKSTDKRIRNELGETAVKKIKPRKILEKIESLEELGAISKIRSEYYKKLLEGKINEKRVSWSDFESRVSLKKDSLKRADHKPDVPKFLADRMKKSGLSRRVEFYSKFDTLQIELLTQIYSEFTDFVDPDNQLQLSLVKRGSEEPGRRFEVLYPSQYCLATMILRETIASLRNSDNFKNVGVTYEDVAAAAIETGFVSADQVSAVLKTDDLWNPKKSGLQRVIDAVTRFGGPALVFVPPPFNMVSSLAITLVQSTKKKDDNECKSLAVKPILVNQIGSHSNSRGVGTHE